jgi:hypothetical protein
MLNKTGRLEELIDIMKERKIFIFGLSVKNGWDKEGTREGYKII